MSIKFNGPNMKSVSLSVKETIEGEIKGKARNIADSLVRHSPVETGAYVESHACASRGSPKYRQRSSDTRPRGANALEKKAIATQQLYADIENLDLSTGGFIFRNKSPHSANVEYGTGWTNTPGYLVYQKAVSENYE